MGLFSRLRNGRNARKAQALAVSQEKEQPPSRGLYELVGGSKEFLKFADSASEWNCLDLRVWVVPNTRKPVGFELTNEADQTALIYRDAVLLYSSYNDEKSHFIEST